MILAQSEIEVKDLGFDDSVSFGIENSNLSKIFNLLSTSTYKNTEESIVREIASNSFDAMVEAGKEKDPIYVKYIEKENKLYFIDNGIGMNPEIINKIYTKLGSSTKEAKSNQIGAFGVGKFSVFAYTDVFYLDTISNGISYSYIISKSNTGLPKLDLIFEEKTDKCNGTTVSFELKNKFDFNKFKKAIINQLKYFKTVITEGFNLNNDYVIYGGEHFRFRPDANNVDGLEISWANVFYPIDWVALGIKKINLNCAIFFPQNTPLKPTVSRESLEMNDFTIQLIKDKIEKFKEELYLLWKHKQVVESYFDWKVKTNKTIEFENHSLKVDELVKEDYIWKPLIGTKLNVEKVKDDNFLKHTFSFIKSNKSYYSSNPHTGTGIYYASKRYTPQKLGKIIGTKCSYYWMNDKVLDLTDYQSAHNYLKYVYDDKILNYVPDKYNSFVAYHFNDTIVGPIHDIKTELLPIVDKIWSEIISKCKNLDEQNFKKTERNYTYAKKQEVKGSFENGNSGEIRTLEEIVKYKHIVFTNDYDEYIDLVNIKLPKYAKKDGKKLYLYLPICCTEKYNDRLLGVGAQTYQDFLSSDIIKKLHKSCIKNQYKKELTLGKMAIVNALHKMYANKYDYLQKYKYNDRCKELLPNSIVSKLKYEYHELEEEFNRCNIAVLKLNEFTEGCLNNEVLKYKKLYKINKSKVEKLQKLNKLV